MQFVLLDREIYSSGLILNCCFLKPKGQEGEDKRTTRKFRPLVSSYSSLDRSSHSNIKTFRSGTSLKNTM